MRAAAAAAVLLLTSCTAGSPAGPGDEPGDGRDDRIHEVGRPVEVTPRALAAVVAPHLAADLEGVHVDPRVRTRWTGCPGFRRLAVEVDLLGADVHVGHRVGSCDDADLVTHRCRPDDGRSSRLRRCVRTTLADGTEVHAGIEVAHQEGRYRVAVRHGDGWAVQASARTDQHVEVPLAELVAAVSDPALGPRIDVAYVRAGRALPTGGER